MADYEYKDEDEHRDEQADAPSIADIFLQEEKETLEKLDTIDDLIKARTGLLDSHIQEISDQISSASCLLDVAKIFAPYNHERQHRILHSISDLQHRIQDEETGAFKDVFLLMKERLHVLEKLYRLRRFWKNGRL